ncbi:hypothetical protein OSTOST_12352, partial [Ostertagia ostertagi]
MPSGLFVWNKKSYAWLQHYKKLRTFVIQQHGLAQMNEQASRFFLLWSGRPVSCSSAPHLLRRFFITINCEEMKITCISVTPKNVQARHYEDSWAKSAVKGYRIVKLLAERQKGLFGADIAAAERRVKLCGKYDPSNEVIPFDADNQLSKLLMAAYGDAYHRKRKASVVIVLKPAVGIAAVVLLGEAISPSSPQRKKFTNDGAQRSNPRWDTKADQPLLKKPRTRSTTMQSAHVYKVLAILVLFCTKDTSGEFGAYAPEFVHIPAQINGAIHDELLRNGLYAEIIGEVADRKEACGIVLLDYTAYVDGHLFEAAIKPLEDYMLAADMRPTTALNKTLRSEVYKTMKATALAGHKSEMRALIRHAPQLHPFIQ